MDRNAVRWRATVRELPDLVCHGDSYRPAVEAAKALTGADATFIVLARRGVPVGVSGE